MKKFVSILMLILFVFLAASCITEVETPQVPTDSIESPSEEIIDSGYPIVDNNEITGYPIIDDTHGFVIGPEFTINTPVSSSDMIVTGSGPAGVPIKLVNVSRVGLLLGETIIDSEGTFVFNLTEPLEAEHLIGIQLGDIEGTAFNESDFLYSESYYERPFVGILFDMVLVEE